MKLDRIEIHNFRSIKDATINFDLHCRILLGKNEAGKSNVLKAIAAVFGDYKVSSKDKRKKIDNEKIDSYYIRAIFKLSEDEIENIVDLFEESNIIVFEDGRSVLDFARIAFREMLISIKIEDNAEPSFKYWKFIDKSFKTIDSGLSIDDAMTNLFEHVKNLYFDDPYICHYWEYNDSFLLPSSINIAEFVAKPTTCRGLKNLFVLCDRVNLRKEFEESMSQDGDYINLLEQVSSKVTSTFRSIWPDFKDTSIQLIPNGGEISIKVSNKAKYCFNDRSDGFKHFVSILLMLSAPSKKGQIGDKDIIIIDEPDTSLYPSSARYLRDELLRIGETSYVVYATHSQYMIDSNCIERHLLVEKKDDITIVSTTKNKAEFSEDELLLNAIGTSIFECLRPKNIIFEGWLDKTLFENYTSSDKTLKKAFKDFGRVYLHGISGVMPLSQLLMLSRKDFVIISDSDETSLNKKKEFVKYYPDFKQNWMDYGGVVDGISTVEDFLIPDYVEKYIQLHYDSSFIFDKTKSFIKNIEKICKDKENIQSIKVALISGAKKANLKKDYESFINHLLNLYSCDF